MWPVADQMGPSSSASLVAAGMAVHFTLGIQGQYPEVFWDLSTLHNSFKHWFSKFCTIVPRRNIELGSLEPLASACSSADQYVTVPWVFCLKTSYLIYVSDSLRVNSQSTTL